MLDHLRATDPLTRRQRAAVGAVQRARAALEKDGKVRPTDYAGTNWEEAFAESYALYATEPDTLRRLRPAVHAYFVKRYPR